MNSNGYYRLRKQFREKDNVEPADYELVDNILDKVQTLWSYDVRGQTVTCYTTGGGASLVVFDNVEGVHAYWDRGGRGFELSEKLRESDAEPIVDISGNVYEE